MAKSEEKGGQTTLTGGYASKNKPTSTKADELAKKQRNISIAEFFEKNRHLLGFDNKKKALLTTIKEAVDNAIDAAEEANVLPDIIVEIIDLGNERFRIIVEDNGPGIIKKQIPKIFAKLLYGSKFHSLKQSRGQQGIGISAAALYGQLTTGKPIRVKSKIGEGKPAHKVELTINTKNNEPQIVKESVVEWKKPQGTRVELDLVGSYAKGQSSVDEYLKQTSITNPHVSIIYTNPKAEQVIFPRVTEERPKDCNEIKPHPYGVELGRMIKMVEWTEAKTMQAFLTSEFCRVGAKTAKEILGQAGIAPKAKPKTMERVHIENLCDSIQKTKIMSPPTDCISPIGADLVELGLRKEITSEFYSSTTRPPSVYRGNPFIIEVGMAYGGEQAADKQIRIMRFANRVPLLYQQAGCAITEAIVETNWRSYGINQSQKAIPVGPLTVMVHIASVWAPFTSEAKEAIAHYPEITKEIKLAIQECGRKLASYLRKKRTVLDEHRKRSYIEKYLPHIGLALQELIGLSDKEQERIVDTLKDTLEKSRSGNKSSLKDVHKMDEEIETSEGGDK